MPNNALVGHTGRIPPGTVGFASQIHAHPFAAAAATPQSGDEPARTLHYMNEDLEVNMMMPEMMPTTTPATAPQIAHFFALYARDG
jgi:hypothetical protein